MTTKSLLMPRRRDSFRRTSTVLLLTLACHSAVAVVIWDSVPLQSTYERAGLVVRGTITRVEPQQYSDGGTQRTCGKNYFIEVKESFKGRTQSELTVAAFDTLHSEVVDPVAPGQEVLVFAIAVSGNPDPMSDALPDQVDRTPTEAKKNCLRQLSNLRLVFGGESAFRILYEQVTGSDSRSSWLVFTRQLTTMPECIEAFERPFATTCNEPLCNGDTRRMIPWQKVAETLWAWSGAKT